MIHSMNLVKVLKRNAPPKPNVCDCCKKPSGSSLHLDHCHETGTFRGWLCAQCNQGIGKLGDNLAGLQQAVLYLSKVNAPN